MFNSVQSTGISFGLDRLCMLAKDKENEGSVMVLSIGENEKAIEISEKLRDLDMNVIVSYDKVSKALDYADSKKVSKVIFVGSDEVSKGKVKVRDMKTGSEKLVEINKIGEIINGILY